MPPLKLSATVVGLSVIAIYLLNVAFDVEAPKPSVAIQASTSVENSASNEVEQPFVKGFNWVYDKTTDPIRGVTIYSTLNSNEKFELDFPYSGKQRATITIRKSKLGNDVYIAVERGQIICSYNNCSITAKFDNGPVRKWTASEPSDRSSNIVFINNSSAFIQSLKKGKVAYIEIEFYKSGVKTFTFDVEGL